MYLDKNLEFDPAGTAITATADSTNQIDFGVGRDMGVGNFPEHLKAVIFISQTFLTLTSLNIQFKLAPDNGSGAPGTYTIGSETGAIPVAVLLANKKIELEMPRPQLGFVGKPRFAKLTYTVVGANATAGLVQAELTPGAVDQANLDGYPSGFTVAN